MTLPTGYDYQEAVTRLHRENTALQIELARKNTQIDLMRERIEHLYADKMQHEDYLNTVVDRITDALTGDLIVTEIDVIPANKLHRDAANQVG